MSTDHIIDILYHKMVEYNNRHFEAINKRLDSLDQSVWEIRVNLAGLAKQQLQPEPEAELDPQVTPEPEAELDLPQVQPEPEAQHEQQVQSEPESESKIEKRLKRPSRYMDSPYTDPLRNVRKKVWTFNDAVEAFNKWFADSTTDSELIECGFGDWRKDFFQVLLKPGEWLFNDVSNHNIFSKFSLIFYTIIILLN